MPAEDAPPRTVLSGRLHTGHAGSEDGVVVVEAGRVVRAGPRAGRPRASGGEHHELPPGWTVLPGLVDLHCHGGFGADFSSSPEAEIRRALGALHAHGTTTPVASLVTAARGELLRALPVLAALTGEGLVAGIHLEGPFLSPAHRGAQDPAAMREPDLRLAAELADAAAGALRTMTLAPELPRSRELAELLVSRGVVPSVGHTDADAATVEDALARMAELLRGAGPEPRVPTVTHLFNAMPALHHRAPGPVPACLRAAAAGRAVVELIADGVHLDPYVVRWVFELAGADGIALVTDAMAATGLADGTYRLGPAAVRVRGGAATLVSDGSIAGGTATLLEVLRRTVAAGVALHDALRSATVVPARVLGLAGEVGALVPGAAADLLVVDRGLELRGVMRRGRWIVPCGPG